jgi:hypothetical protein
VPARARGGEHRGRTLEIDRCAVSATGLLLLKTLMEDHIAVPPDPFGNQMLPADGFWMEVNERRDTVTNVTRPGGIDWSVTHEDGRIKVVTGSGKEAIVDLEAYREEVHGFADRIEAYYNACSPKMPYDELDGNWYTAFWNEWHRRRNANP